MNRETISVDRTDNIPLAVGVIIFAVFALSLGDALIKLTSGNFVIWQIFVIRSMIAIPCLVFYLSIKNVHLFGFPMHSDGQSFAVSFWCACGSVTIFRCRT